MRRGLVEKARLDVLPYRESLYWVFFEDVLFTPMLFYRANTVLFDNRLMYLHRRIYELIIICSSKGVSL